VLLQLKVFNSTIVVLSSPTSVHNILDKHGAVTGGRARTLAQVACKGKHWAWEGNREYHVNFSGPSRIPTTSGFRYHYMEASSQADNGVSQF
jgi:hypothetical protein